MDKLILDQIQIEQSFGLVCLDTPTLIEKLKKQTVITKDGLEFYGLHRDGGSIVVPYEKWSDFIKPLYKPSFTSM